MCYFARSCFSFVYSRYVSLSDNEKTGFKARELKSVQVDAVGVFLKLNIHKNHINKYNLYNQVGLKVMTWVSKVSSKPIIKFKKCLESFVCLFEALRPGQQFFNHFGTACWV